MLKSFYRGYGNMFSRQIIGPSFAQQPESQRIRAGTIQVEAAPGKQQAQHTIHEITRIQHMLQHGDREHKVHGGETTKIPVEICFYPSHTGCCQPRRPFMKINGDPFTIGIGFLHPSTHHTVTGSNIHPFEPRLRIREYTLDPAQALVEPGVEWESLPQHTDLVIHPFLIATVKPGHHFNGWIRMGEQ
jgi:hypothetical protein